MISYSVANSHRSSAVEFNIISKSIVGFRIRITLGHVEMVY